MASNYSIPSLLEVTVKYQYNSPEENNTWRTEIINLNYNSNTNAYTGFIAISPEVQVHAFDLLDLQVFLPEGYIGNMSPINSYARILDNTGESFSAIPTYFDNILFFLEGADYRIVGLSASVNFFIKLVENADFSNNHKTLINGSIYNITAGKCLINGTDYNIKNGCTLINGVEYNINLKPTIVTVKGEGAGFTPDGEVAISYIKINNESEISTETVKEFKPGENVEIKLFAQNYGSSYNRAYIMINGEEVARASAAGETVEYTFDATGKNVQIELSFNRISFIAYYGVTIVNYE